MFTAPAALPEVSLPVRLYAAPSETSIALPVERFWPLMPRIVPVAVESAVSAKSVPVNAPVLLIRLRRRSRSPCPRPS